MNRIAIIRMAHEAQGEALSHGMWSMHIEDLERFAALVAAAEREANTGDCYGVSTPFDVDGLWQIRLTITSPRQSRFQTQGYIDEEIKDKILAALYKKPTQTSDNLKDSDEPQ